MPTAKESRRLSGVYLEALQKDEEPSIRNYENYLGLGDGLICWAFSSQKKDKVLFSGNELRYEHLDQVLSCFHMDALICKRCSS